MSELELDPAGLTVRRAVLGDEHVDRSLANATTFSTPWQEFVTNVAWGRVWTRPGLERRTRSMLTIALLAALRQENELGQHHVSGDIGCHLFSILPPFNIGSTTMGYGLSPAAASAFNVKSDKRVISVMGDGGFWHNGLATSIGNAVFNKQDGVILVVDNFYSAATGGQDILSSRAANRSRSTHHPIERAVRGVGVNWVKTLDRTYDVGRMRDTLKEALTTKEAGPKVIVAGAK